MKSSFKLDEGPNDQTANKKPTSGLEDGETLIEEVSILNNDLDEKQLVRPNTANQVSS